MTELLLAGAIILVIVVVVLQVVLLVRKHDLDFSSVERAHERTERTVREEIAKNRTESSKSAREGREELNKSVKAIGDTLHTRLTSLTQSNDQKLKEIRETVEKKLDSIQKDNNKQLEEMRKTVDEKLHDALEKRLGESFKVISERLEKVHRGLGEMQTLANGVGDLKRVLTNVKTRGTWGEIQLGALLEQILSPEQYSTNVATKGGGERVEFTVNLPGPDEDIEEVVWLPLDSKFPIEDYQRLVEASEKADADAVQAAGKELERQIKGCAKKISETYVNPPKTTDFAIMFLPIEGLYAEVVQRSELVQTLQREYRVVVAGPMTLAALLNSLQMGFRTLAIQKRSSEVWQILSAVKTEFGKFGEVMGKVQKKLQEASNTIEDANVRTRAMERKLRVVEELPAVEATELLGLADSGTEELIEDEEPAAHLSNPK